eukprot:1156540-Pelagomonas_calceolata.AAC.1
MARLVEIEGLNHSLKINWAVSNKQAGKHTKAGGLRLDALSGSAEEVSTDGLEDDIRAHGAMMVVAFAVVMPLAMLLARHSCSCGDVYACSPLCKQSINNPWLQVALWKQESRKGGGLPQHESYIRSPNPRTDYPQNHIG